MSFSGNLKGQIKTLKVDILVKLLCLRAHNPFCQETVTSRKCNSKRDLQFNPFDFLII